MILRHTNLTNPQRCLSLEKPKENCRCSKQPFDHNTLASIVITLFENVGINGHFTTTTTWMLDAGVDKQLIMDCNG